MQSLRGCRIKLFYMQYVKHVCIMDGGVLVLFCNQDTNDLL